MNVLGDTFDAIAREKAGILKEKALVVFGKGAPFRAPRGPPMVNQQHTETETEGDRESPQQRQARHRKRERDRKRQRETQHTCI